MVILTPLFLISLPSLLFPVSPFPRILSLVLFLTNIFKPGPSKWPLDRNYPLHPGDLRSRYVNEYNDFPLSINISVVDNYGWNMRFDCMESPGVFGECFPLKRRNEENRLDFQKLRNKSPWACKTIYALSMLPSLYPFCLPFGCLFFLSLKLCT